MNEYLNDVVQIGNWLQIAGTVFRDLYQLHPNCSIRSSDNLSDLGKFMKLGLLDSKFSKKQYESGKVGSLCDDYFARVK